MSDSETNEPKWDRVEVQRVLYHVVDRYIDAQILGGDDELLRSAIFQVAVPTLKDNGHWPEDYDAEERFNVHRDIYLTQVMAEKEQENEDKTKLSPVAQFLLFGLVMTGCIAAIVLISEILI